MNGFTINNLQEEIKNREIDLENTKEILKSKEDNSDLKYFDRWPGYTKHAD